MQIISEVCNQPPQPALCILGVGEIEWGAETGRRTVGKVVLPYWLYLIGYFLYGIVPLIYSKQLLVDIVQKPVICLRLTR